MIIKDIKITNFKSLYGEHYFNFDDLDGEYLDSNLSYNFVDAINTVYVVGDNPNGTVAPTAFRQNKEGR